MQNIGHIKVSKKFFRKSEDPNKLIAFVINESRSEAISEGDYVVVRRGDKGKVKDLVLAKTKDGHYLGVRAATYKGYLLVHPIGENSRKEPYRIPEGAIVGKVIKTFFSNK